MTVLPKGCRIASVADRKAVVIVLVLVVIIVHPIKVTRKAVSLLTLGYYFVFFV